MGGHGCEASRATLLSFRFLNVREVLKLVRESCPTMGNIRQHSRPAGGNARICRESFVFRSVASAFVRLKSFHALPPDIMASHAIRLVLLRLPFSPSGFHLLPHRLPSPLMQRSLHGRKWGSPSAFYEKP